MRPVDKRMVEMYTERRMSIRSIAKEIPYNYETIRRRLIVCGVKMRHRRMANRLRFYDVDPETLPYEEIERRYRIGECPREIAKELSVLHGTVVNHLRRKGLLSVDMLYERRRMMLAEQKDKIVSMYVRRGMGLRRIGASVGASHGVIRRFLVDEGFTIRGVGTSKNPGPSSMAVSASPGRHGKELSPSVVT